MEFAGSAGAVDTAARCFSAINTYINATMHLCSARRKLQDTDSHTNLLICLPASHHISDLPFLRCESGMRPFSHISANQFPELRVGKSSAKFAA